MTIAKYESFVGLFRMASSQLSHLPLASTHRPSIAFFLILTTIFAVPFLALSPSVELLPRIAFSLWDSLFGIFTSSPFYFFLLNFLIAALVLSSGILDASSSRREFDDPQEEDVHQRGHHNYRTAAQIFHERLALDELYGAQASPVPYLSFTESSHVYVADDGVFQSRYGDEGEDVMGKHIVTDQVASFLLQGPSFSHMEASDDALPRRAFKAGSSSSSNNIRMDVIGDSSVEDSMAGDDTQVKKISPLWSVDVNGEIATLHDACLYAYKDIDAKGIGVYNDDQHSKGEVRVEDSNDMMDGCANAIIGDDSEGGNDVNHYDDDGNLHTVDGYYVTDMDVNDCHVDANAKQIPRIASQPMIAGSIKSQKDKNVGSDMGSFSEDVKARSICLQEESVTLLDEEEQRGKKPREKGLQIDVSVSKSTPSSSVGERINALKGGVGEEEQGTEELLLSMSAEELNERASAFITAFRRKLISTAIDDEALVHTRRRAPGQM